MLKRQLCVDFTQYITRAQGIEKFLPHNPSHIVNVFESLASLHWRWLEAGYTITHRRCFRCSCYRCDRYSIQTPLISADGQQTPAAVAGEKAFGGPVRLHHILFMYDDASGKPGDCQNVYPCYHNRSKGAKGRYLWNVREACEDKGASSS